MEKKEYFQSCLKWELKAIVRAKNLVLMKCNAAVRRKRSWGEAGSSFRFDILNIMPERVRRKSSKIIVYSIDKTVSQELDFALLGYEI